MMILEIGGSGSGKSAYGEKLLDAFSEKYYIATMLAADDEAREKVRRHRENRKGKGFVTVEQPRGLAAAAETIRRMRSGKESGERAGAALLECVSNLTANEMFLPSGICREEDTAEKVISGILSVAETVDTMVIVSNNVFEDGICYDEGTMSYLRALASVNRRLAQMADCVIEVVVGIPVVIKEK